MHREKNEPPEGREPHGSEGADRSHHGTTPPPRITPVEERIGEGRDNLRQRGEWFQRRSGR